ncbi:uncharacterized protein MELLADRAFT_110392 [Melampsora larici-populina 98AG31]|uniref:Uncharacterized protein n=1 Tax=Melampsora larici-populina (strain 98AG31 / pathotype 3-4-7) TaxID=747676 RepID=F4RZN6_MELLP|nr:uncharacterized protein MELLADRAFT_110392 [Melampsora larici-populina 98AG31]EGG02033.1 hypothetical protein MELLADRAFT_110392 [Melampsora larici-populina 98AG31]
MFAKDIDSRVKFSNPQTPTLEDHRIEPSQACQHQDDRSLLPIARTGSHRASAQTTPFGQPPSWKEMVSNEHPQTQDYGTDDGLIIFANPLPVPTKKVFEMMANYCTLDAEYRAFALSQSEVFGKNNRHLAGATTQSLTLMEILRLQTKMDLLTGQVATLSLMGVINSMALKLLFSPLLDSYTALETTPEGYLPNLLFNTLKLLVGIHDPKTKELVTIPVPTIKNLVQRVAVRCGEAKDNAQVEEVWAKTDHAMRARIAYLLILDEDCQLFDGKTWFKTLKAEKIARNKGLDLPSEADIIA